MGIITPDSTYDARLGFNFKLQFIPNTQNYVITDPANVFEAVSIKDNSVSRADCIEFTPIEQTAADKKEGIYYAYAKVTKAADDIRIRPKCALVPKITSVWPPNDNTSYPQDSSIKVSFNKAIKLSDFADEDGQLKNITIKTGDTDLLDTTGGKLPYYKSPYLENDGKTLVIPIVKGNYLIKDNSTKDISVSLKLESLTDGVEGENAAFIQKSYDFTFRIDSKKDTTPPTLKTLRIARTEDDARNGINLITMDEFTHYAAKVNYSDSREQVAENIQNHHVNKVWVYFEGEDADSGVSGLEIKEQLIRKTTGDPTEGVVFGKDTNLDTNFIANPKEENSFSGLFEYNFKSSEDGVVKLDFILKDRAGQSTTQTVDLVKDTVCNVSVDCWNSRRYISDYPENEEYPFLITIGHHVQDYIFIKDMNGGNYYDTYNTEKNATKYSEPSDSISFEYGYDQKEMNYIDLKNAEPTFENDAKRKNVNFYANPYKTLYIQVTICDAAGNLKTVKRTIPAAIEVVYTEVSASEFRFILNNVSDYSASVECYYSLNNDDEKERGSPYYTRISNSIFSVPSFIDGYTNGSPNQVLLGTIPDGYYSFTFYSTGYQSANNYLISYFGDSVVIRKQSDSFSLVTNNSGTALAQEDVPDFEVTAEDPVKNAGNRIIHVNYKNFTPKPNLKYMIYYEGDNSKGYSSKTELTVPSEYSDYNFKSVVFNEKNQFKESAPKPLNLREDNIPPKIKSSKSTGGFNYPKKSDASYNMCSITLDIDEKNYDPETIKCIISDNSNLENIDWENENDSRICELPIAKDDEDNNYWTFDYYYYNQKCLKYCYVLLEDLYGNFREEKVYIPVTKVTSIPKVSYNTSDNSFSCSNLGDTRTKMFINNDKWSKCSNTTNNLTFSNDELKSFILIQSKISSNGDNTVYKPLYFYAPYEIAKNTTSPIVCDLKDLYIGQSGINILADKPCFAHTMYCPQNLGNTPADWLEGGFETGLVMKSGSFTYANTKTSGVPKGYYYTTVVHFADGTTLMTDVKQK